MGGWVGKIGWGCIVWGVGVGCGVCGCVEGGGGGWSGCSGIMRSAAGLISSSSGIVAMSHYAINSALAAATTAQDGTARPVMSLSSCHASESA